jgi:putative ABC transport system permease protein
LGLAALAIRALLTIAPHDLPRADEIHIAPGVIGFALGASLLAGILSGLVPAMRLSARGEMNRRDSTEERQSMRTRSGLVIVEIALSSALLCGAALLIQSFLRVRAVDPGFRPEHVLTMRLAASGDDAANLRFYDRVLERVGSLPGVDTVGVIEDALQRRNPDYKIMVAGRVSPWSEALSGDAISPKALEALGVRLLTGRWFSDRDRGGPRVAIINETMAGHIWGSGNPVGKHFREADAGPQQPWDTIVGVVADMHRQGLERQPIAQIFWPHFARASEAMDLVIRTTTNASALAPAVVHAIRVTDRDAPVSGVATLEQRLDDSLSRRRWESSLLGALSTIALILASVGVYGLVHFSVVQRTREIGIRMALGAQAEDVVAMIVRQGVVLALIGMGAGLIGIMAMTRALSALLFGVTSGDPATLTAVIGVNFVMTLAACAVPARKASRIDPLVAIRCE